MARRTKKYVTLDEAMTMATGMDKAARDEFNAKLDRLIDEKNTLKPGSAKRKKIEAEILSMMGM